MGHYLLSRDDGTYRCTCGAEFETNENEFFAHMDDLMKAGEAQMEQTMTQPHVGPLGVTAGQMLHALSTAPDTTPTLFDLVKQDLDERDAKGWREHGKALILSGDTDYLKEAYEEELDKCVYLKGEILKRERGHTCTICGHKDKL